MTAARLSESDDRFFWDGRILGGEIPFLRLFINSCHN